MSAAAAVTTSAAPSTAGTAGSQSAGAVTDIGPIKATTPMWRCSRIMHIQRDMHPTVLSALEGIVDQVCTLLLDIIRVVMLSVADRILQSKRFIPSASFLFRFPLLFSILPYPSTPFLSVNQSIYIAQRHRVSNVL